MADSNTSYMTEVSYPTQFHREHAPVWLEAVLKALGRPAPASKSLVQCEVGCGSGFGLCVLAAANRDVAFHGIDINPRHIADATALAKDAQLANVTFHCADLRDLTQFDECDYIIVRGIYSWVARDVRAAIDAFIARHLSPTGLALVHYMALPGAADMLPVQRLFRALHQSEGLAPQAAIQSGHAFLNGLIAGRAGFFEAHPVARMKIAQEQRDEIGHTIHDYLNDAYEPLLCTDVMASMAAQGLAFAGSATPFDNLDDFTVPVSMRNLVNAQPSLALREAAKDFASNQFSRIDLYVREDGRLSQDAHIAALRKLELRALVQMPDTGGVTFDTRIGPVDGPPEIFQPIISRLRAGETVAYTDLERIAPFSSNPGLGNQAFHALIGAGAAHPVPSGEVETAPARRLNAVLLQRHRLGESVPALAASAIGSGVPVGIDDLDALASGKPVRPELAVLLP